MIRSLVLLCVLAPAVINAEFSRLHENPDKFTHVSLPISLAAAEERGWVASELPTDCPAAFNSSTLMTNKHGKSWGLYYNPDTGICMGAHIAFDKKTLSNMVTDTTAAGYKSWVTTVNGTSVEYLYTSVVFSYGETTETPSSVCVTGYNGKTVEFSTKLDENPTLVKQKCMDGYGTYYFYEFTSSLDCSNLFPWYFQGDKDGNMIGCGCYIVGKRQVADGQYEPMIHWPTSYFKIEEAFTDPPTCFTELAEQTGFFGGEMFVIEDTSSITC